MTSTLNAWLKFLTALPTTSPNPDAMQLKRVQTITGPPHRLPQYCEKSR